MCFNGIPIRGYCLIGISNMAEIKAKERGAKDDWEALKIVLDQNPALKQRVLHKMRDLRKQSTLRTTGINITKEQVEDAKRQEKFKK